MIKIRRETLGFSQARLGELVGRSASTIRNWERGKSRPSAPSDAVALAAVLGLSENRVVEAAGFETGDLQGHQTVEQAYASLAPQESPGTEPVESEPAQAEPMETEALPPEPMEPGPTPPEESKPATTAPEEAESEPEPGLPSPSPSQAPAAADAVPSGPDDAKEEEESSPLDSGPVDPSPPTSPPSGRRLRAISMDTDAGDESAEEPSASRAAPPTVLETSSPVEPSYLEDPDERQRYRARALATAAVVLFLLIVFLWSFDRTVDALGTMWDDFTGMLEL